MHLHIGVNVGILLSSNISMSRDTYNNVIKRYTIIRLVFWFLLAYLDDYAPPPVLDLLPRHLVNLFSHLITD